MGAKKPYRSVEQAFGPETVKAFRFLVDELGFAGPARDDFMMPTMTYQCPVLRYKVSLDTHEDCVTTSVRLERERRVTYADLELLVTASGLGSGQHVFSSARTVTAVLKALTGQARWLRRLHPILVAEGGAALIERVGRGWTV